MSERSSMAGSFGVNRGVIVRPAASDLEHGGEGCQQRTQPDEAAPAFGIRRRGGQPISTPER
jgi:hypothetical protein